MKKALITGITGQDGYYLAELLLKKGYEVHGVIRKNSSKSLAGIELLGSGINSNIVLHYADLLDSQDWVDLFGKVVPDEIYNLAAQSHVQDSFDWPEYTCNITGLGALRILEALRQLSLIDKVRFYQASSSEMFGNVLESPQTESTPFCPRSPYACAKVMAHYLTIHYREYYNMYACAGILFNHESPQRAETFVTRKITKAAARIKLGLQDELYLGALNARRDWGYAGDYVEAMWLMLQQERATDYIIASGEVHSVQEFVEEAFGLLELDWQTYVKCDVQYQRPAEVNLLQGNPSKLKKELGWASKLSFKELVKLMVAADYALAEQEKFLQCQSILK